MKRLTSADLPTRTSPTRTTLQSCLNSLKRCLTLPILCNLSTLTNFWKTLIKQVKNLSNHTSSLHRVWMITDYYSAALGSSSVQWHQTQHARACYWRRRPAKQPSWARRPCAASPSINASLGLKKWTSQHLPP